MVDRLGTAGVLTGDALLAHCVHVSDAEVADIAACGATVAHNPRSNMNNRVGYSPLARSGERVALGTDGIGGDMITESQLAYFRATEAGAATAPAWPLERLAEGGRLAGRIFGEPRLGSIAAGAPADLTVLSYDPPAPLSAANLPGHWVFGVAAGPGPGRAGGRRAGHRRRPVHPRRRGEDRRGGGSGGGRAVGAPG